MTSVSVKKKAKATYFKSKTLKRTYPSVITKLLFGKSTQKHDHKRLSDAPCGRRLTTKQYTCVVLYVTEILEYIVSYCLSNILVLWAAPVCVCLRLCIIEVLVN